VAYSKLIQAQLVPHGLCFVVIMVRPHCRWWNRIGPLCRAMFVSIVHERRECRRVESSSHYFRQRPMVYLARIFELCE
jgi:hypothetical protein